jgi:hypothetical protein
MTPTGIDGDHRGYCKRPKHHLPHDIEPPNGSSALAWEQQKFTSRAVNRPRTLPTIRLIRSFERLLAPLGTTHTKSRKSANFHPKTLLNRASGDLETNDGESANGICERAELIERSSGARIHPCAIGR